MSYDHVYNSNRKHLSEPPFKIPREEIFTSEEQEKKINLKTSHAISKVTRGYNTKRMHIYWTDHMTLPCIRACNVGFRVFVGLVYKCAGVMIGLTPSCSRQVKGDGKKVKQSELELHKRMGRGGGVCGSPSHKKN